MLGYDDALDAFGVHAVGGIVGALLTGVSRQSEHYGGTGMDSSKAIAEHVLNTQIYGIKAIVLRWYCRGVVSLIILKVVDIVIGLRVTDEEEREGLDLTPRGDAPTL